VPTVYSALHYSAKSSGFNDASELQKWEAEAEALTSLSYATEAEDTPVNVVTSDGDGTFTYTPQAGIFSALHYSIKAGTFNPALYALLTGATFTGQVKGITPVSAEDLARKDYVDAAVLDISSTVQAQAGTDDTTAISPLKLREGLNASGTAPIYACRAWVNFNGTGTVAIRASGNVSSIGDNGVGDYTMNFITAIEDTNYSLISGGGDNGGGTWTYLSDRIATARTVSAVRLFNGQNNVPHDVTYNSVAIMR
jgi:hypothetical protein